MKTLWQLTQDNVTRLALGIAGVTAFALASAADPLTIELQTNYDKVVAQDGQEVIIKLDVIADRVENGKRLPLNLAIVLDRSGSMSGAKIEQARQGAAAVIDQLNAEDTIAVVTYESDVEILVPAQKLGDDAEKIRRRIFSVQTAGSTALYGGVEEGGRQLREFLDRENINRVILLSDGLANVGPQTPREISRLGTQLAGEGIQGSTIGLGANYNEDLMTALAEASDANYYFVEDIETLPEIFAEELGNLSEIVARDVIIKIRVPEGMRPIEIIGRNEDFSGREASVRMSHFTSGQRRELLIRCELDGETTAGAETSVAEVEMKYADELSDGKERQQTGTAKVTWTESSDEMAESRNAEVAVRVQQTDNDMAKYRAANLAKEGNRAAARQVLTEQATANAAYAASLPSSASAPLDADTENLNDYAAELESASDSEAQLSAKEMKEESWLRRQSKMR
jgi:Ca-activated chloride channel family protein